MELREWLMVRISKLEKLRNETRLRLDYEKRTLDEIVKHYERAQNNLDLIESEMNEILLKINELG